MSLQRSKATPIALVLASLFLGVGVPYFAGFRSSPSGFVTIPIWIAAGASMIATTWDRGKGRAVAWLLAVVIVALICRHEMHRLELLGFERRVKQLVDVSSLRRWADQNLLNAETKNVAENRRIEAKDLPPEYSRLWELRPTSVFVRFNAGDERWEFLTVYCGGGFFRIGIILGRADLKREESPDSSRKYLKRGPGIYYFTEG